MGFIEEGGILVGISLGFDFCAEHEWGITPIKQSLGIQQDDVDPWNNHVITKFPSTNVLVDFDEEEGYLLYFVYLRRAESFKRNPTLINETSELKFYSTKEEDQFVSAWDDGSFGIHVRGAENVKKLKAVYGAFCSMDIVCGYTSDSWRRGGLVFAFNSLISEQDKNDVREKHHSHNRLIKAVQESGIEQLLKDAGCEYFALSPKWIDPTDESKGFRFWLNPWEQQKNNCGWFTLEELKQWANGEGPIPKTENV